MTNKKFVKNPFGDDIIYKTGDVAKYKFNGDLIYVGRNDNQVKIRGFRIEIEEVEKLLLKIKGVKKVIVFAHGDTDETKTLYAFIAPEKGVKLDINDIKNNLLENIPLYMLPLIYVIEDFPVNTNGKADKRKLIEYIDKVKEIRKQKAVPAKTPLEKKVLKIFKEESSSRINGITDNIFENGMDSLQVLKAALELTKININVSAQDIYDAQTVEKLCKNIENNKISVDVNIANLSNLDKKEHIEIYSKPFNLERVFLTGASGFLGVHILNELIKNNNTKKIYCLIRRKNNLAGKTRLDKTYKEYFENENLDLYKEKVEVIEGDFLNSNLGISKEEYSYLQESITCVINAAADVKHIGRYEDFYKSNVTSVENLLKLVKKNNISFAHISTESVCGYDKEENVVEYKEDSFDISQMFFDNVYITTKFEAEKKIEEFASKNKNSNVKIFRLGNIMPREKDGKFQINYNQNAFMQKVKGIINVKLVPDILLNSIIDISPVDVCAKSVVTLIEKDDTMGVYHISNENITVKNVIDVLNEMGYNIKVCSLEDFRQKILTVNDDFVMILQEQFSKLGYDLNIINNTKTLDTLENLGVNWTKIDKNYMKYITRVIEGDSYEM